MGELSFYRRKKKLKVNLIKEVVFWIVDIAVVIFLAVIMVYYFGNRTSIIGNSMSPTVENGNCVLINKLSYSVSGPKRNDVVVFKPNGNEKSHYYVKRVIGLPGEKVQIKDGEIFINGKKYEDEFTEVDIENAGIAETEVKVGDDEYFVLGDNRNDGEDSRYANIGNVKKSYIEGKAWILISPFSKFGFVD